MPNIIRTPRAIDDFDAIWLYIAQYDINAADRMIDLFEETCRSLALSPLMGRACPELAEDLRRFPVKVYVVFYRPVSDGIEVVRVLHGARDIENLWADEESDPANTVH